MKNNLLLLLFPLFFFLPIISYSQVATVPYEQTFESLSDYWGINDIPFWDSGVNSGKGLMIDGYSGINDSKCLKIWSDILLSSEYENPLSTLLNTAVLNLKLDPSSKYVLSFSYKTVHNIVKKYGDECYFQYDYEQESECGVYLSANNGQSYVKVMNFMKADGNWQENVLLDISAMASTYGLNLGLPLKIKFQYYCAYGEPLYSYCRIERHLLIDNVKVVKESDDYKVVYQYNKAGSRTARDVLVLKSQFTQNKSSVINTPDVVKPLELNDGELSFIVFPNPTKGMVAVQIEQAIETDEFKLLVYDSKGMCIRNIEVKGSGPHNVDLQDCSPGLYVMNIFHGDHKTSFKIIKE